MSGKVKSANIRRSMIDAGECLMSYSMHTLSNPIHLVLISSLSSCKVFFCFSSPLLNFCSIELVLKYPSRTGSHDHVKMMLK